MIKIVDMADEVWRDLGTPPDTTIPYISTWFRTNVGKLDNSISANFIINPITQEIIDQSEYKCNVFYVTGCPPSGAQPYHCNLFGIKEADIFKEIFKVKYYESQINKFLYAGQFNLITNVIEGDSKVSRQTLNDLAKTAITNKKDAYDRLTYLCHQYKFNKSSATQVQGNDFISASPYYAVPSTGPGWFY